MKNIRTINAFAGWEEFNRIIALGGWEGRNETSGPYCYFENGGLVLDPSPDPGGSGREEPLVFTVDYGKARIFHLMLGHAGATLEDNPAMQCTGFQTLLLRSTEWAATGNVTQPVPADFPTAEKASLRRDYGHLKK